MIKLTDAKKTKDVFNTNTPVRWVDLPNILDSDFVLKMKEELDYEYRNNYDKNKVFTRAGSNMFEVLNNHKLKYARELINYCHSSEFLNWLESVTGYSGLICDHHLIGAGYMRCGVGDSLKIHTDFNWNDKLRLHRAINVIFYLNPEWDESWNGDLQLWSKDRTTKIHSIFPSNGNMLIWEYDSLGFHGHPNPLNCPDGYFRDGFRFFYYISNSTHNDKDSPHRSLYYYDNTLNKPVDEH